jgi:hypothetical protein
MQWPRCGGHKLSFLGQLRLADLPQGVVPADGVVTVFADIKEDEDGVPPVEVAYGRVGKQTCVIVRALHGALTRRAVPKGVPTLHSRPMTLRPTLTVPDVYVAEKRYGLTDDQDETWWKLEDEAMVGRLGHKPEYTPNHQVLGWPWPIQDTPLYGCGGRAKRLTHRLFLQLDYDEALGFAIGDGAVLYLTGTAADLRAGRFNRLCAEMQES